MTNSKRSRMKKIVGENIKSLRERKFPGHGGQKQCSEEFGVLPQQWSQWEAGKRLPNEKSMGKIAELFGVEMGYMYKKNVVTDHPLHPHPVHPPLARSSEECTFDEICGLLEQVSDMQNRLIKLAMWVKK